MNVPFAIADVSDVKSDNSVKSEENIFANSLPVVWVTGKRASLASAQEIKQEKKSRSSIRLLPRISTSSPILMSPMRWPAFQVCRYYRTEAKVQGWLFADSPRWKPR